MIINRSPEAPVGICVTFDDDTEVPIEVGYQGLNEEGEHLWLQVSPDTLPRSKLKSYHMDKLPENTVIRFVINEFA
jgi:hypothetical protein